MCAATLRQSSASTTDAAPGETLMQGVQHVDLSRSPQSAAEVSGASETRVSGRRIAAGTVMDLGLHVWGLYTVQVL